MNTNNPKAPVPYLIDSGYLAKYKFTPITYKSALELSFAKHKFLLHLVDLAIIRYNLERFHGNFTSVQFVGNPVSLAFAHQYVTPISKVNIKLTTVSNCTDYYQSEDYDYKFTVEFTVNDANTNTITRSFIDSFKIYTLKDSGYVAKTRTSPSVPLVDWAPEKVIVDALTKFIEDTYNEVPDRF